MEFKNILAPNEYVVWDLETTGFNKTPEQLEREKTRLNYLNEVIAGGERNSDIEDGLKYKLKTLFEKDLPYKVKSLKADDTLPDVDSKLIDLGKYFEYTSRTLSMELLTALRDYMIYYGEDGAQSEILEFAAWHFKDNEVVDKVKTLYKPKNRDHIPQVIATLTHISDEDVKDCPSFDEERALKLKADLGDGKCAIVGHNIISFDIKFLNARLAELNLPQLETVAYDMIRNDEMLEPVNNGSTTLVYDTLAIARRNISVEDTVEKNHKLGNLAKTFNCAVTVIDEKTGLEVANHDAFKDVADNQAVFLKLLDMMRQDSEKLLFVPTMTNVSLNASKWEGHGMIRLYCDIDNGVEKTTFVYDFGDGADKKPYWKLKDKDTFAGKRYSGLDLDAAVRVLQKALHLDEESFTIKNVSDHLQNWKDKTSTPSAYGKPKIVYNLLKQKSDDVALKIDDVYLIVSKNGDNEYDYSILNSDYTLKDGGQYTDYKNSTEAALDIVKNEIGKDKVVWLSFDEVNDKFLEADELIPAFCEI